MKRILPLLLAFAILLPLFPCAAEQDTSPVLYDDEE